MRKQTPLLLFLCLFNCIHSFSQKKEIQEDFFYYELFQDPQHIYTLTENEKWAQSKNTITYENQGEWHSQYLCLNPDFTFMWLSYYEVGNGFSFGHWAKINDSTLTLNWDSRATNQLLQSKEVLERYGIREYTIPLRIKDWCLTLRKDTLLTNVFYKNKSSRLGFVDSMAAEMDRKHLLVQVDTSEHRNPSGFTVGYSIDSAFFDSNHLLVKFVRTGKSYRTSYYFLPNQLYKSVHQPINSNGQPPSTYYFDDQKLIDAKGVTNYDEVRSEHEIITTWKFHLIYGQRNKF